MRRALWIVLAVVLSVVVAMSVAVMVYLVNDDEGETAIEIDLSSSEEDGVGIETSYFNISGMVPGDSVRTTYSVKTGMSGGKLSISFEYGENTELADFLLLTVSVDGKSLCEDENLTNVVGNTLEKDDVEKTSVTEITYTMPLETGNEAKGLALDLEIGFSVEE